MIRTVSSMAVSADTLQHVQPLVDSYLRTSTDVGAGPISVRSGSAVVNIRLLDTEPTLVRVYSAVVQGVPESPDLLSALNEINATTNFIRLFWRDETVFAADELLAQTLDLDELVTAVDLVADLADHYDDDLVERFGGEVGFVRS